MTAAGTVPGHPDWDWKLWDSVDVTDTAGNRYDFGAHDMRVLRVFDTTKTGVARLIPMPVRVELADVLPAIERVMAVRFEGEDDGA